MGLLAKQILSEDAVLDEKNKERAAFISSMQKRTDMDEEVGDAIKGLWELDLFKERFRLKGKLQIIDSASYFFDNIDRIAKDDYVPTDRDVVMSRSRTVGINEVSFKLAGSVIRLVDVGGQRSERRKWIHCFEDVTVIFYIAAISEYNQVLREDESTNRLLEAMKLFDEISNCDWFAKTPIILFLNKSDLFEEKIKYISLGEYFKEFTDGNNYEKAIEFMKKKFHAIIKNSVRQTYIHITCATNTQNVVFVFKAFQDIFLNKRLDDIGIA
jgi:guanine nucleotide-binding protein subunit alpha